MGAIVILVGVFMFLGLTQAAPDGGGTTALKPGTRLVVVISIVLVTCFLLISWVLRP